MADVAYVGQVANLRRAASPSAAVSTSPGQRGWQPRAGWHPAPQRMVIFAALVLTLSVSAQTAKPDEDFRVYTDSPRLLLTKQRLRLLQRERERASMRWELFDSYVANGARMPEPGFAWALYYQVARNTAAGKNAVEWALGQEADAVADLRQLALVFDWCGPVMTPEQTDLLGAKIERGIGGASQGLTRANEVPRQSARILAAIAIADRLKDHGESILRPVVENWWRGTLVRQIEAGKPGVPREHIYAFLEMLHALRDNITIDLRESVPAYFQQLPLDHLTGHYPAPYPGPDNDFMVPVYVRDGNPDLSEAALSRAAGLAMVAYDNNAVETQYLQGWLLQDHFLMRGPFGIPYEFLWANPYQPGLSYSLLPLVYHNPANGDVFARTSWEEDATWIGYLEGQMQVFRDGKLQAARAGTGTKPVQIGDALLMNAPAADSKDGMLHFEAMTEATFVLGLAPRAAYDVEIDDEELAEQETDAGGTLVIALPAEMQAGVRIKKR
ncbi:MAG: hypothetical protein JO307_24550 [Bryobacterales bacterium]|nr:hypothetical protein [Bryobacterales bacterium]